MGKTKTSVQQKTQDSIYPLLKRILHNLECLCLSHPIVFNILMVWDNFF